MGNPIDNLGDYNLARDALKAVNGNYEKLIDSIGESAIAEASPGLLLKGGGIGVAAAVGILTIGWSGKNCIVI